MRRTIETLIWMELVLVLLVLRAMMDLEGDQMMVGQMTADQLAIEIAPFEKS